MKVLLIKPPQPHMSTFHIMPPLGLGYIASSIRNHCEEITILDCVCDNISLPQLMGKIKQLRPDVVGLTVYPHDLPMTKTITNKIKQELSKEIATVIGGPHPSTAPRHSLEYLDNVDFGFKGEAEVGFSRFIESVKRRNGHGFEGLEEIPGLIYRDNGSIRINQQSFEDNLDHFGFPAWDILDPTKYFKTCQGVFFKKKRFASLFATRGCPYYCSFCAMHNIMGRKLRVRSVGHIIEEIKYLQSEYGIEEFHFLDDNFTFDKQFAISFCDALLEQDINIGWTCPNGVRLDNLDREVLVKMKSSGCYALFVGIESGSQEVLNRMRKGLRIAEIAEKIRLIKELGFSLTGFFILGFPGETKEDMQKTIQFARSLPIDIADFSNFLPLPGTSILEEAYGKDAVHRINYGRLSSPAYVTNSSSRGGRKNIQRKMVRLAYLQFYLRWHILIKLLRKIRSPYQIFFLLKRIYAYILTRNH